MNAKITCMLIRHGKTQGNIEKRYIGCQTDEPLSETGISELKQQMAALGDKDPIELSKEALLFVSPMLRAKQTAKILFPQIRQIAIEELKESDFGRFEGKNYAELNGNPEYQSWIDSGGTDPFPGGESPADFRARSYAGFEKAVREALEKQCTEVRIVAHGGTGMAVMSRLTGNEYFDFMVNCGKGFTVSLEAEINEEGTMNCLCTGYEPWP